MIVNRITVQPTGTTDIHKDFTETKNDQIFGGNLDGFCFMEEQAGDRSRKENKCSTDQCAPYYQNTQGNRIAFADSV